MIQLRLRERALLRQGQLFEPTASSGPAAMLLAISRNLSCIPRRSPCPGRYPLPLAYGVLSTFRNQQYPPDGVPARPDILSLWRPLFSPTFLPTKKAGSSAHSLQTLTQTKNLTPKPKEAPSTSYYNVPITVDTRISVVPVFRTPTQDVPLFLNTVPM